MLVIRQLIRTNGVELVMYMIAGSIRSFEFGRRWGSTDARMKGTGLFFSTVVVFDQVGIGKKPSVCGVRFQSATPFPAVRETMLSGHR